MGVDVDAEVMIGVAFNSFAEVESFLKDYGCDDGDICGWEHPSGLVFKEYTGYSDKGGYVGVEIIEADLSEGSDEVDEAYATCRRFFPKELHNKIEAHIWARYW